MKGFLEEHHRLFGVVGGVVALVVAAIYLKVTPDDAAMVDGFQEIVLVYGHSLCWILLAAASLLWAIMRKNKWSKVLAYAALVAYIIFIGMLLVAVSL